jgi:L-aspartate oxidase
MRTVLGMDVDVPDEVPAGVIGGRFVGLEPVDRSTIGATLDPLTARAALQRELTFHAGVLRDAGSLERAAKVAADTLAGAGVESVDDHELRNLATVARAAVDAALRRQESRGAHTREDFPDTDPDLALRFVYVR